MKQLISIFFIFLCSSVFWSCLGLHMEARKRTTLRKIQHKMGHLWGGRILQKAPSVKAEMQVSSTLPAITPFHPLKQRPFATEESLELCGTQIHAKLRLERRKKGLFWFNSYHVSFSGTYCISLPKNKANSISFRLKLPQGDGTYQHVGMTEVSKQGKKELPFLIDKGELEFRWNPKAKEEKKYIEVRYQTRGLQTWQYALGEGTQQTKNFEMKLETRSSEFEVMGRHLLPTSVKEQKEGQLWEWKFGKLIGGLGVGVRVRSKLDPTQFVSGVAKTAPIGLFFYFFVFYLLTTLLNKPLHPIYYFFLSASCFSCHVFLAYVVDFVGLDVSYLLASGIMVWMVFSYLSIPLGKKMAFLGGTLPLVVYMIFLGSTFFFEELQGLSFTLLGIITLFLCMQITARTKIHEKLFSWEPSEDSP